MIQIEVQNGTTFRRRIFLHALPSLAEQPITVAMTTWKYLNLDPGASIGTVDGDFQIGVRSAQVIHGMDYETAFAEANFGDEWLVQLTNGMPVLSRKSTTATSLVVVNGIAGVESAQLNVTLYRDYAPLLTSGLPPNQSAEFVRPTEFYCYSSMPIANDGQPLVLEPVVGRVDLRDPQNLRLQLVPSGSTIQWKVNGQPVDLA